jgi:nickel/cobalt transporter (NicO) family protein
MVSTTTPALVAAAAGVGFGHAILPDHWVPLGVLSRTHRYPLSRVARLAGLAGVAHVLVSLVIGAVIVIVGLQLRSTVEHVQNAIVGGLLIATGVAFAALEATGRGHSHPHGHAHDDHAHDHDHDDHAHDDQAHDDQAHDHDDPAQPDNSGQHHGGRGRGAFMVSFGAAASPDLTILPVFLAATTAGAGAAIASLVAFAAVTVTTIVILTLVATIGGYGLRSHWLERWGNAFTALVLVGVGALVLTGTI